MLLSLAAPAFALLLYILAFGLVRARLFVFCCQADRLPASHKQLCCAGRGALGCALAELLGALCGSRLAHMAARGAASEAGGAA